MNDFVSSEDDNRGIQPRFRLVYAVLAVVLIIIIGRLWQLQIMQGQELRTYSERNRIKETKVPAPRGLILDRQSRILVDNVSGFDAMISPQYATNLEDTASAIAPILNMPPDEIVKKVKESRRKNGPFRAVRVKENLTMDELYRVEKLRIDHPGLDVHQTILRYYPLDENGAQLFGYVGEVSQRQLEKLGKEYSGDSSIQQGDLIGQSGLEEVWDHTLRGRDGLNFIEVDAHGRESTAKTQAFSELKPIPEVPGHSLVLTLDQDIQQATYKAMLEQTDKTGPRIGGVVVMRSNGEILAWVITPSFNPNKFARGISSEMWKSLINDPFKPLRNKVIQDHYMPGSAFKPIVALAALQEKVISPRTIVSAPGAMRFGNRTYHDSLRGGHGDINVVRAIESSSNVFFYKMGIQLGIDSIAKYAKALGLGERTGIKMKNEVSGNIPTKEWKLRVMGEPWQPGENLSNAIGQGFVLASMLQMAVAYNAIGLEGKVYHPFLVERIIDQNGKIIKQFEPQLIRDISLENDDGGIFISKEHLRTVKKGLHAVANGEKGTARWWKVPGVEFAGKTGTIQLMSYGADDIYTRCESRPLQQRHHGAFIGYAPSETPEITIAALTEHSCHGNTGSVPVVRDIIRAYMEKYHPQVVAEGLKKPTRRKVAESTAVAEEGD